MIDAIELWHKRARPEPTDRDFNTQIGCHFEEFEEMLSTLTSADAMTYARLVHLQECVSALASQLKRGIGSVQILDRCGFLDSLADQVVTAIGAGHCAGMRTAEACERVNASNWTKTVDGEFIRDANGKIAKPATYVAPDLTGLY